MKAPPLPELSADTAEAFALVARQVADLAESGDVRAAAALLFLFFNSTLSTEIRTQLGDDGASAPAPSTSKNIKQAGGLIVDHKGNLVAINDRGGLFRTAPGNPGF